jgi:hypothetical protein
LANRHLANGHLSDGHLADGHLFDGHLADGHLADGYLKRLGINFIKLRQKTNGEKHKVANKLF